MTAVKPIQFASSGRDFLITLQRRVNDYFTSRKISRHANAEMVIKTIFMFGLYLIPYTLILTGVVTGALGLTGLALLMGFGMAGIGLSVMHDANHGAYSGKKWINTLVGYSLNFVGANKFNWTLQHNVLHHTFTNIHDEDEDISPRGVLRMSPQSEWKRLHKYQHVYAWFLYGLMTIVWTVAKDFIRIVRYHKSGLAQRHKARISREWAILLGSKALYFGYIFLVPLWVTSIAGWQLLIGIFIMHYLAGFVLAIIFQPAHVIDGTEYPVPDDNRSLETNWAVHQLRTTTNFANTSRWFSWYVGGLNFQIEHHLFPHICHVHYRRIAAIVQSTAAEFGHPYKSVPTFVGALAGHARLLRKLGRQPEE